METLIVGPTLGYTDLFQFDCKDFFKFLDKFYSGNQPVLNNKV